MSNLIRRLTPWTFAVWSLTSMGPTFSSTGDGYLIKLKPHPDIGKTAKVDKHETMHSHSKLVGALVKKVLENNEEKQSARYTYRETILETPKGANDPTRLRRHYDKAQTETGGNSSTLFLEGKTILIEKKQDRYRFSVEGGQELTGKEAKPLVDEFQSTRGSNASFTDLIPADKPVRVHDKHDIDPKVLLKIFGSDAGIKIEASTAQGSWQLTRVYKKAGRQFGVIELQVELPLREISSTAEANPKAVEKLVMRPGAKMTLKVVIDGCIDGSAAIATSAVDMEINGTAAVPSPENPQFDLILAIKTGTKVTIEE